MKNAKLFWNGVKINGERSLIKGHWSYQRDRESLRFYFAAYSAKANEAALLLGGSESASTVDDCHTGARFDIDSSSPLWLEGLAVYGRQEERRAARVARREAKQAQEHAAEMARRRAAHDAKNVGQSPIGPGWRKDPTS